MQVRDVHIKWKHYIVILYFSLTLFHSMAGVQMLNERTIPNWCSCGWISLPIEKVKVIHNRSVIVQCHWVPLARFISCFGTIPLFPLGRFTDGNRNIKCAHSFQCLLKQMTSHRTEHYYNKKMKQYLVLDFY